MIGESMPLAVRIDANLNRFRTSLASLCNDI